MNFVLTADDGVKIYAWDASKSVTAEDILDYVKSSGDVGGDGASEHDVTNLRSKAKEYAKGLKDSGSLDVTQLYGLNTVTKAKALETAGNVMIAFVFTDQEGESVEAMQCEAICKSVKRTGINADGIMEMVTSFRLSGDYTYDFVEPTAE